MDRMVLFHNYIEDNMNIIETLRNMPVVLQVVTVFPLCLAIFIVVILISNISASLFIYKTRGREGWNKWMEKKWQEKVEIEKKKRL